MQRIIKILVVLILVGGYASAQSFPNNDSLRRYIDKYIRNSAIDAFTNLRLNTALKGTIGRLDSVAAMISGGVRNVDSLWKQNDSTFAYRIGTSTYYLTDRGGSGGSGGGTIDLIPTDGSGNAVSSNGVFDALATKAATSHAHSGTDITSGFIPTGRYQSGTVPLNALAATGTLNNTTFLRGDGTFAVPPGATYSATAPIVLTGAAFSIPVATNSVSGYLSSTDRTAFAAKLGASDTLILSTRINYAYVRMLQLSDSTIGFQKGDGSIDTLQITGITGGSSGGGGGGSGTVTTFSAGNLSPLFTTIVTNSNTTPALAFTLSNAAAYSIMGRGAGSGLPSYLTAIDSNWAPTLHSQAYYDGRYALIGSAGSVAWSAITSKPTTLSGFGITDAQPLDADLTTIAGLTATTDNFIIGTSSAWASRTPAQAKTSLALNNVDNTSDASKPVSTAQATAIALKATPAQVSQIVHDSLGPAKILRNKPGAGDSLLVFSGDSILANRLSVESGTNITVSRVPVTGGYTYIPNFTGSAYTGERYSNFNTSYTVSLAIGFIQNLGFYGTTASRVITLPTGSAYDGLTLYIYNYASVNVTTSTAFYWPDGSTSSSSIGSGLTVKLVYSFAENKYFIYMQAHI